MHDGKKPDWIPLKHMLHHETLSYIQNHALKYQFISRNGTRGDSPAQVTQDKPDRYCDRS